MLVMGTMLPSSTILTVISVLMYILSFQLKVFNSMMLHSLAFFLVNSGINQYVMKNRHKHFQHLGMFITSLTTCINIKHSNAYMILPHLFSSHAAQVIFGVT